MLRYLMILAVFAAFPNVLKAQVPGDPTFNTDFRSYSKALEEIITPGSGLIGCPGLVRFDASLPPPPGYSDLSPALQNQCFRFNNGAAGATLSGGFGEPFSTRTFLPFTADVSRPRTPDPIETDQLPRRNFLANSSDPFIFQTATGAPTISFVFGIEAARVEEKNTEFEIGRSGESYALNFALLRSQPGGAVSGLSLTIGRRETDADPSTVFFNQISPGSTPRLGSDIENTRLQAAALCQSLGRGSETGKNIGLTAFHRQPISTEVAFTVEAGISRTRTSYSNPLCSYTVGEQPGQDFLFLGTIEGRPRQTSFHVRAAVDKVMSVGGSTVLPRFAVTARHSKQDGYTETEVGPPAGASVVAIDTPPVFGGDALINADPTGVALIYEDRKDTSVTAELGVTWVFPSRDIFKRHNFWVDAAYIHQLTAPDRTVQARFAGDGRAVPTRFTFLTNDVDRGVATVGFGFDYLNRHGGRASIRTSALLGDDFEKSLSISAVYSISF